MENNTFKKYSGHNSFAYFFLALLIAVIALGSLVIYVSYPFKYKASDSGERKSLVERQLEELNRKSEKINPPTEEELKDQFDDLNNLKGSSNYTEEEINQQLEELNKQAL